MELTDIAADLFEYIVSFRQKVATAQVPDIHTVRYELESIFQNMETKLAAHPPLAAEYRQAKYPLVALADEIILTSAWTEAKNWEQYLLEKKFFSTNIAGNQFFELLKRVEQMPRGVVTIFFYCLAFGFRGGFEMNDPSVKRLQSRLLGRVADNSVGNEKQLFPAAYHVDQGNERKLTKLWKWKTVLIIGLVFLVLLALVERVVVWPMLMGWQEYNGDGATEKGAVGTPGPTAAQVEKQAVEYTVQLGVFGSKTLALHFAEQMDSRGLKTRTIQQRDAENQERFLVITGKFNSVDDALLEQQKAEALTPLVTKMAVIKSAAASGECIAGCS